MNAPNEIRPKKLKKELDLDRDRPSRAEFLHRYFESLRAHGFPRELANARRNGVSWLLATAKKAPHEITREDYEQFLATVKRGGASEARCAALRRAVASAYDDLCGRQLVRTGPARTAEERAERRRRWRESLLRTLVRDIGLDPRDVAALRWTDVDFTRARLVWTTNEGRGRRAMTLSPRARALLHRARRRAKYPEGYLFPARRGGHASERSLRVHLEPAVEKTADPALPVDRAEKPEDRRPPPEQGEVKAKKRIPAGGPTHPRTAASTSDRGPVKRRS